MEVDVANKYSIQQKFWFAWLPLSLVGFTVIYLAFYLLYQVQIEKLDEQVNASFHLAESHIQEDFSTALADLNFIANNPITQDFVDNPSVSKSAMVQKLLLSMSESHARYDQMRLLSAEGKELIRVNFNQGKPTPVHHYDLQDKSNRYYFKESLNLAEGNVFISKFDLNMEHGKIETPEKPTIRMTTSLVDQQGDLSAIVVLNYFGKVILDHFEKSFRASSGKVMLLNSEGYWLFSSGEHKTWDFMYGEKARFQSLHPEVWQRIQDTDRGIIDSNDGRFYFSTIQIPTQQQFSNPHVQLNPWKVVVFNNEDVVGWNFFKKHLSYLYPLLIAYPLGSVLLWYWARAASARDRAEAELVDLNASLEQKVRWRTEELEATREATILSLATLAETRDNETGQHIRRTQRYAKALAEQLSKNKMYSGTLTAELVEEIYKSAPLHDIGKVGIPDNILHKPGSLTNEEFEIMKTHTTLGSNAIEEAIVTIADGAHRGDAMTFLHCARDIAHYHHERWDGSGYPKGLCGEAIPITARIMALVDVYDALVSARVYKKAFSRAEAEDIILNQSEGHFDPNVLQAFSEVTDLFWEIRKNFADPPKK